jgi:hypothetical protein
MTHIINQYRRKTSTENIPSKWISAWRPRKLVLFFIKWENLRRVYSTQLQILMEMRILFGGRRRSLAWLTIHTSKPADEIFVQARG